MNQIIDGRRLAKKHESDLRTKIETLGKTPILVSILVGDDPASVLYTQIKKNKAESLGIEFRVEKFEDNVSTLDLEDLIRRLNQDNEINGIMIQLPLPSNLSDASDSLISQISGEKDVDGLRVDSSFLAATVRGIIEILNDEGVKLADKTVVVVGSQGEVGSRLMKVLECECQELIGLGKDSDNWSESILRADVLISSTGRVGLITGDMVKDGVVVIDVGSEKTKDGQILGDVEFASVAPKASKITPVPGGVGPMTVISLMENLVEASP